MDVASAAAAVWQLGLVGPTPAGQSGFQATRTLAKDEATKNIPVIICTSKGQETDKNWGMKQGARDYIVKPIAAADLLAKISALG